MKRLKKELEQMPDANTGNVERLKSASEVVTYGHDGLEKEAIEMVMGQQIRNNDTEIVAAINQTDIGNDGDKIPDRDEVDLIANEENQHDEIVYSVNGTTMGGIAHDPNTDNGEDGMEIDPIVDSSNATMKEQNTANADDE